MRGFSETKCSAISRVGKERTLQYLHSLGTRIKAEPEFAPRGAKVPLAPLPYLLGIVVNKKKCYILCT